LVIQVSEKINETVPNSISVEEILESIDPDLYYQGSIIRQAITELILLYEQIIEDTAKEAVAKEVRELLIKIAGLEAWKEGAEEEIKDIVLQRDIAKNWATGLGVALPIALVIGITTGLLISR
jgi:hypothetical protein